MTLYGSLISIKISKATTCFYIYLFFFKLCIHFSSCEYSNEAFIFQNIPSEAPRHVPGIIPEGTVWPSEGAVKLTNVCVRYRPNLPLVLKSISADVKPGEKIGIVGRTGAGECWFPLRIISTGPKEDWRKSWWWYSYLNFYQEYHYSIISR